MHAFIHSTKVSRQAASEAGLSYRECIIKRQYACRFGVMIPRDYRPAIPKFTTSVASYPYRAFQRTRYSSVSKK